MATTDLSRTSEDRDDPAERPGAPSWNGLSPRYVRDVAAARLKALGHPDRLRIVEVLTRRPTHVGQVAAQVGLPLGTVSRHMRVLHAAGIVDCSHAGNKVLYALSDREVPRLTAVAYRGAAVQARRVIAAAPDLPEDDLASENSTGT